MSISKTLVVKKSNQLIEARYTLPISAQKLVAYCASKINADDEKFLEITVTAAEMSKIANVENPYEELSRIADMIFEAEFEVLDDKGDYTIRRRWVSEAKYAKGKGHIVLKFNDQTEEFLLRLKEYTQYELSVVKNFFNIYTLRIYELLIIHKNDDLNDDGKIEVIFDLENFRRILVLDDKYDRFAELKRKVLIPSLEELSLSELDELELDFIKSGRKVSGLRYTFKLNDLAN